MPTDGGVEDKRSVLRNMQQAPRGVAHKGNVQSILAAHTRWHINRGIVKDDCPHCEDVV